MERLSEALIVVKSTWLDMLAVINRMKTDTGPKTKTNRKKGYIVFYKKIKRGHVKNDCKSKNKDKGHKGNYKKINLAYDTSASESSANEDQCKLKGNYHSWNFLTQHVLEPTFKSNILDLIVTDDPGRIFSIINGPPLGYTDKNCLHATLSWNYSLRSQIHNPLETTPRLVYQRGNYELFNKHVLDCTKLLDSDTSVAFNQFVTTYSTASALAIPTCVPRARNRPNPKWFNANIKQLTKKKYILHCRIRSAPRNSELKALYVT
ncbi:hypothetical protein BpHYR1_001516, partial [Brachionus plicatilis]